MDRPIFPGPPDTQGAQAERIERVLVTDGHFIFGGTDLVLTPVVSVPQQHNDPDHHFFRSPVSASPHTEGYCWVVLGQSPPEIAYWERSEWWLCGNAQPWQPEAVIVVSDRLVFRPPLKPVA